MALENYKCIPCGRSEIRAFIELNHYSGSINGCISDYCFKLINPTGDIVGAMFFGRMAMANQYKRFSSVESEVTELRRLCCIDETPKNAESFFIGYALRWIKKNTKIKIVVSYADSEYGHSGIIYKAANFNYLGKKSGAKVILHNGKQYHDKSIRTYYKGELKPFAKRLKDALENGEAIYKTTAGKHTYVFNVRK